jgi:DNA-binding NarL/FixJ family response regulator
MDMPATGTPAAVVVAEDPLVRSGLASLLGRQGIRTSQTATLTAAADSSAEVAVWDLGAEPKAVPERLEELARSRHTVVALLPDPSHAREAYEAGARALLLRDTEGPRLAAAMQAAAAGLFTADPIIAEALVPESDRDAAPPPGGELTPREAEVLENLASGLSNKEIGGRMGISDHTVKFHVNAILHKLGAGTRTEAVVRAARRGWITL